MAAWACPSCGGENPEGMRFCGHCGAAAGEAPPAEAGPDLSHTLRSFVAEPVADRLVEGGGELPQERRLISALFADVSGFTSLADRLDPEELLEVIDPIISGLSSIVGRYEGYVEKFAGDALLALFGAPISHEDDAERALLVALEMHAELARLCEASPYDAELTLHCGVNSGHGIARILGSDARMDYAVLGDSVILAQRLESAAPKGETYVSELTMQLTRGRFEFEPVGDLTLKGKSEPVPAWRLLGQRRSALPVERGQVPIGRELELETIETLFLRAREGWGGALTVTGEPGVGKSRLTDAAHQLADAHGLRWLQTRCLSYGAGLAYWPYVELLRGVANIQTQTSSEEAEAALDRSVSVTGAVPFFARLLGLEASGSESIAELEPEAFRRGLGDAFAAWLSSLAGERPLVLVIEDVHWADLSSVELTRELARICERQPLVLYVTTRPEAEAAFAELAPGMRSLRLEPLGDADIAVLVERILESAPPPGLVQWVVERTTGNPFFVEELVRALREHEILERRNGSWTLKPGWEDGEVPPTIEGLLAARIDLLPAQAADLLQTASVVGRVVPLRLLAAVSGGETDLAPPLETLVQRGFLDVLAESDAPTVGFHHALLQDVAYSRLLRRRRRDLHRRVAEVAENLYGAGDDALDLLARHLYLADAGRKAIDYLVRAGDRSRLLYANEEAILHLTRATELADREGIPVAERAEIMLALADLHDLVGAYEDAARLYADVREHTSDLRAWRGLTAAHRKRGEYEQALAVVDEAIRTEALVDTDLTPLWLEQGTTLSAAGHFEEAIEVLELGVETASFHSEGRAAPLLVPLARAELMAGRGEEALRHASAAQREFEQYDDLRALSSTARLLGDIYTTIGRPDEAVTTLERGLELAQRVGNIEEIGGCLINLGLAHLALGAYSEAVACNERAIAEFERIGHGSGRALGYSNLAWVLANRGDYDEAERYCEQAIELSRSIGHLLVTAETTDTMAFIRLRRGVLDEAAAQAEEASRLFLELGASPKAARSLELAASAWDAAGDEQRAHETRSRARALA
jgi:adenylate cyclase